MNILVINTEKEYEHLLDWIDDQFEKKVDQNTSDGKKLKEALLLVKEYEDIHFQIPDPK